MQCPSCKSHSMKPTQLTAGLPSMMCSRCNGHSINLLSYRHWAEQDPCINKKSKSEIKTDNSSKALICTKCSKIMLKYNIANEKDNKVDICTTCDDAWLDQGEWELLVELQLHGKLTDIVTSPWQSKLRKEFSEKRENEKYLNLLGETDLKKLDDFKDWLNNHSEKHNILSYLRN